MMIHPILSYVLLLAVLILLLLSTRREKSDTKPGRGYSKYAVARDDLSNAKYGTSSEIMHSFLKGQAERMAGQEREKADAILKRLVKFSKKKGKKDDLSQLAKEYLSVIRGGKGDG